MNITSFRIIDSTLREGEQFALAHFTVEQKLAIASALDRFGVDYMELTSPVASPSSEADLRRIAMTERRFRLLTHVRCNLDDARLAIDTAVDGVDVLIATSSRLRTASHGMSIDEIIEIGGDVVAEIRGAGYEARFSTEDSFRPLALHQPRIEDREAGDAHDPDQGRRGELPGGVALVQPAGTLGQGRQHCGTSPVLWLGREARCAMQTNPVRPRRRVLQPPRTDPRPCSCTSRTSGWSRSLEVNCV
jgi:hypothetical protein